MNKYMQLFAGALIIGIPSFVAGCMTWYVALKLGLVPLMWLSLGVLLIQAVVFITAFGMGVLEKEED